MPFNINCNFVLTGLYSLIKKNHVTNIACVSILAKLNFHIVIDHV